MKKDCAFQFATEYSWREIKIHKDTDLITLDEAKKLWEQYLPQFIKELQEGDSPEMVIWIEMDSNTDYQKELVHIDKSNKTDGKNVYEVIEKKIII